MSGRTGNGATPRVVLHGRGALPRSIERKVSMAHTQYAACIEACNACADACDHCATACLQEANPKPMARCVALDMDCAAICRTAAGFMARGSELAGEICAACAEVCETCGAECEKHEMQHCKECAEACRRCAQECRSMAKRATGKAGRSGAGMRPGH